MILNHNFDAVVIYIGSFPIRWYGLMYLVGILTAWLLGNYRIKHNNNSLLTLNQESFTDLLIYMVFGLLVGGRLGYMLFYQLEVLFTQPWQLFLLWQGGMSFHGGLIGAAIGIIYFCYKNSQDFFVLADFIAPLAPPAFFFGRIGNFINGELWGKPTEADWGVIFPMAGNIPRHPSQLYEGFLEGIGLFFILWFFSKKDVPKMATSGLFLVGYGVFRFIVEFWRVPDQHIGYVAFNWLTMGQLLSIPLIILGSFFIIYAYTKNSKIRYCYS